MTLYIVRYRPYSHTKAGTLTFQVSKKWHHKCYTVSSVDISIVRKYFIDFTCSKKNKTKLKGFV